MLSLRVAGAEVKQVSEDSFSQSRPYSGANYRFALPDLETHTFGLKNALLRRRP